MMRPRSAAVALSLAAIAAFPLAGCGDSGSSPSFTTNAPSAPASETTSPAPSTQVPQQSITPGPTTGDTLKAEDVENLIKDNLSSQAPGISASVTCPQDIPVQQGGTFECTATVNGQTVEFTGVQEDTDGNVQVSPKQAILLLDLLQQKITEGVTTSNPGTWTTTCNPAGASGGVYVAAVGSTFTCEVTGTASDGSAEKGTITVEVKDTEGNVSYSSD